MAKKETIESVLSVIDYVYKFGNIPVYDYILKNYKKGYKPARDFVKGIAEQVENGYIKCNIDLMNYLTNLEPSDIIPYTYSRYPKA